MLYIPSRFLKSHKAYLYNNWIKTGFRQSDLQGSNNWDPQPTAIIDSSHRHLDDLSNSSDHKDLCKRVQVDWFIANNEGS